MNGQTFPWGNLLKIHRLGNHTIYEYLWFPPDSQVSVRRFHVNLSDSDAEWSGTTLPTLESAMVQSVCQKLNPGDTNLAQYVMRLIGDPSVL